MKRIAIYMITYDLRTIFKTYNGLFDAIKGFEGWWHYLDKVWLVSTKHTADEIFEILKPHINENDNILIIQVGKDYQGWLPKEAWDWINKHI